MTEWAQLSGSVGVRPDIGTDTNYANRVPEPFSPLIITCLTYVMLRDGWSRRDLLEYIEHRTLFSQP